MIATVAATTATEGGGDEHWWQKRPGAAHAGSTGKMRRRRNDGERRREGGDRVVAQRAAPLGVEAVAGAPTVTTILGRTGPPRAFPHPADVHSHGRRVAEVPAPHPAQQLVLLNVWPGWRPGRKASRSNSRARESTAPPDAVSTCACHPGRSTGPRMFSVLFNGRRGSGSPRRRNASTRSTLAGGERLDHVVVRAGLQAARRFPPHPVRSGRSRHRLVAARRRRNTSKPVTDGQHGVERHQVGRGPPPPRRSARACRRTPARPR